MGMQPIESRHDSCPYVNDDDPRCESRFGLGRLDQAFTVCFGSYRVCPMYHRMSAEAATGAHMKTRPDVVEITAHGQAVPLRATGT